MGYDARVKKLRRCQVCGRDIPSSTAKEANAHQLDCARRQRLAKQGIVTTDAPTGQLIEV